MGLETFVGKYIGDLNASWPVGSTDTKGEGDNHIRGTKLVLQNSFPNITGAVTSTHAELNILDGVTATAAQLNLLAGRTLTSTDDKIDNFPAGTYMLFVQTDAPTGWVKYTGQNDVALRIVSGNTSYHNGSGVSAMWTARTTGSTAADLAAHTHTGTTVSNGDHTHTINRHSSTGSNQLAGGSSTVDGSVNTGTSGAHTHTFTTDATGSGGGHTHTLDMAVAYQDVILAFKS